MLYTITLNPALDRELTVPNLGLNQVLRAQRTLTDYGGKGFNISRALLAMGVDSIALGFVGGTVGRQLKAGLTDLGIRTDLIQITGETRTNLTIVAEDHKHYLKVNEPGPMVTECEAEALLNKITELVKPGDLWILAGSTPPGIQPAYVANIINLVQASEARAVLDMQGASLLMGCKTGVFLIKPNFIEAGELTGMQIETIDDAVKAITSIHVLGARQVVISIGKTGAVYSNGNQIWWAIPPQIEQRNPIGAGDAMLAGVVWALQKKAFGEDILRWGVACGAAAASLDGTAVGSLSLVESLVKFVRSGMFTVK
jgi:1-phosphofructokinase family hexose kinase